MKRWTVITVLSALVVILIIGCSTGQVPVIPGDVQPSLTADRTSSGTQTHLWGWYDIYFDFENRDVVAVPNHTAMFTANVTTFTNNSPANLQFDIFGTPVEAEYVDVDIDVSITHPFPGIHQYDGYDVRGVFMGEGSALMDYGDGLYYGDFGVDQVMKDYNPNGTAGYPDPYDGPVGDPDGYTRWFNKPEFIGAGVLGYTHGKMATPNYTDSLTSTLNPYKYFADGLEPDEDVFDWLMANEDSHGIFTAGSTNTRNYYLRFPLPEPGVRYGYAILATWGEAPDEDPLVENAIEAVALSVDVYPDLWYADSDNFGGDFEADISLWDWGYGPSTIYVETVLHSATEQFDPALTLVGGGDNYSTYHVEFEVDSIPDSGYQDYWVIAEYDAHTYTQKYPAPAPDATLAAFFRNDIYVNSGWVNQDPVCDLQLISPAMPYEGWAPMVEFDASGSYDPDGWIVSYEWDFDGDGVFGDPYDAGTDENPTKYFGEDYTGYVCVRVTDDMDWETECCVEVDITAYPTRNINITNGTYAATDLAIDPNDGDILVYYPMSGQVRRYYRDEFYQNFTTYTVLFHTAAQWIDCTFTGYFELAYYQSNYMRMYYYNNNGTQIYSHGHYWTTLDGLLDVTGSPDAGSWPGALGCYMISDQYWSYGYIVGNVRYSSAMPGYQFTTGMFPSGGGSSPTTLNGLLVRGGEADISGNSVWWVEETECTAIKMAINNFGYQNTMFGQWMGPNDADNRLYSPKDITRDDENTFYILDELSTGDYVIKGFTVSGTSTTHIDSFGTSGDFAYEPIRIEGSDYDGLLAVLQIDGSSTYMTVFPE